MELVGKASERTPRGQGDQLRERLIDAALALLDEGSERENISIRGVTKRAGVSPTAFYLHFDSREQLMRALVERGFADFRVKINTASSQSPDPQKRLIDAGVAYIGFARGQPERYRLIFGADWDQEGIKDNPEDSIEIADAAFSDLVELISTYMGASAPGASRLDALALGLWSGLHGYVTLCHAQPGLPTLTDEQYASMLADAWLGQEPGT